MSDSVGAAALLEARPPATDKFTYLTLIEQHLSPDVLPTLHTVLQDASLTQEIGWDLVDMLVPLLPASEACLDDIARLGNPREVILKVLEVLEGLSKAKKTAGGEADGEDDDDEFGEDGEDDGSDDGEIEDPKTAETTTQTFVVLLGMLGILHRRIKTKFPSRFLESTLRTILAAYRPDRPAMTTAVLGLVRSLAAGRRPTPPVRRSSSSLATLAAKMSGSALGGTPSTAKTPTTASSENTSNVTSLASLAHSTSAIGQVANNSGQPADDAVAVPDPEAETLVAPAEGAIQQRLLQSFVTCVLEKYVSANEMAWAPRLLEVFHPNKLVPGRPTLVQSYKEDAELVARDSAVGQLVALALDLGLKYTDKFIENVCSGSVRRHPLLYVDVATNAEKGKGPEAIPLSTGGSICLLAYWVFSSTVFKSDTALPIVHVFPDHLKMMEALVQDDATSEISRVPGTIEALVAIGLWLDHNGLYYSDNAADTPASYMPYHHLLTLCAVFHPTLSVRNASTVLAGAALHADPDPDDRLKILQDLLENCMFASLKACAVSWLREEIIVAARDGESKDSLFGGFDAVEQLQYAIFPDLQTLQDTSAAARGSTSKPLGSSTTSEQDEESALLEYWVQNSPFLIQAANFAYFLFCSDKYRTTVVPPGMGPAIDQRFVEPLMQAATRLQKKLDNSDDHELLHLAIDLDVLRNRLSSLKLHEA